MLGNEIKKNLYFKYGVSLLVALVISLFFRIRFLMIYLPALQKKQDWSLQQQPSEISNQVDQI